MFFLCALFARASSNDGDARSRRFDVGSCAGDTTVPALPLFGVLIALYAACRSGSVFPIDRHLESLKVDELLILQLQALLGFIVAFS